MTPRQILMLKAIGEIQFATVGPCDLIDTDYKALLDEGLIEQYWASSLNCSITDEGRERLEMDNKVVVK